MLEVPFKLERRKAEPITPSPCLVISNVQKVTHYGNGMAMHDAWPEYPRALCKGDWT